MRTIIVVGKAEKAEKVMVGIPLGVLGPGRKKRPPERPPEWPPEWPASGVASGGAHPTHLGDRFKSKGAIMIDESAINVCNTHNQITDAAKKELYVKELDNNIKDQMF